MNDKQIEKFCSGITISDVISYIDAHPKEYEQFIKEEQAEKKKEERHEIHTNRCKKKANKKRIL